jgi:hypothetical protein
LFERWSHIYFWTYQLILVSHTFKKYHTSLDLVLGYFLNMGHLGPSLSFHQFDASKYLELEPVQSWHYLKSQVPTKAGSGTRLILPQVMRTWKLVGSLLMVLTLVSTLHSRDMPRLTLVCNNVEWVPILVGKNHWLLVQLWITKSKLGSNFRNGSWIYFLKEPGQEPSSHSYLGVEAELRVLRKIIFGKGD